MAKKKIGFKPNRDWVLLPDPRKTKTDSGIILSEASSDSLKTNILEALDVGPTCEFVSKGDTVMVNPQTEGVIIELEDTTYVLVPEFHILGIVPSSKKVWDKTKAEFVEE
jgi:co-chaperonin GroES (HSP10)